MIPCFNVGSAVKYTRSCIQSASMVPENIRMLLSLQSPTLNSILLLPFASCHCFVSSGATSRSIQEGDGQLGGHPPCVATGAAPQGPSGQETTLAEYPQANTANPVSKSGARSRWFQFRGWPRVCGDTGQTTAGSIPFPCPCCIVT